MNIHSLQRWAEKSSGHASHYMEAIDVIRVCRAVILLEKCLPFVPLEEAVLRSSASELLQELR